MEPLAYPPKPSKNIMNIKHYLQQNRTRALPILSFPAVQKLGISVDALLHSASLQADAMELIARETDTLAAVSPMDLSLEAEAFGAAVRFAEHEVPAVTGQLVCGAEDANALRVPALLSGRIPTALQGVRTAKERICDKPVLAGMIGPFSLAGRLTDVTEIMYLCFDEPETVHTVLKKATDFLITYAKALKDAGADGIIMAEPLAGVLSPDMAGEFSVPYVTRIIDAVQTEAFGVIYHNCGNAVSQMLPQIFSQNACAYHFGNAADIKEILTQAPADVICMGNIDPVSQFAVGTPDTVRKAVRALMRDCGAYPNFILSSGCDIPAHAKWENIDAFFDALKEDCYADSDHPAKSSRD